MSGHLNSTKTVQASALDSSGYTTTPLDLRNTNSISVSVSSSDNAIYEFAVYGYTTELATGNASLLSSTTDTFEYETSGHPHSFITNLFGGLKIKFTNHTAIPSSVTFTIKYKGATTDGFERTFTGSNFDAFGRLRISEPVSLFDAKQTHDKLPLFFDEETGSTGASVYQDGKASTLMTVSDDGDFAISQTKMRYNYAPGRSLQCICSGSIAPSIDVLKVIGLAESQVSDGYNISNGIYFSSQDGYVSCNVTNNGATRITNQSEWNTDKLDGYGISGTRIDFNKSQIFTIDYEWLGLGKVRFGVFVNGKPLYCHQEDHKNVLDTPYVATPNLPIQYSIRSTASGASGSMHRICSAVLSESGSDPIGRIYSYETKTHVDANTIKSNYGILGFRLKSDRRDVIAKPIQIGLLSVTNDPFMWFLCMNPNVAGDKLFEDIPHTALQVCNGVTANTIDDMGFVISSGFVSAQSRQAAIDAQSALYIGSKIGGECDQLWLVVRPLTANLDVYGSVQFKEL